MTRPNQKPGRTLKSQLLRGFSASALGPVVTIFVQLVTVPLFLKAWGSQRYGEWLLLSAIPSYLSISDMGFGSVAGNEMTMLVAAGNRQAAIRTFHSTLALILLTSSLVLGVAAIAIQALPMLSALHIRTISSAEIKITLSLLSIYSLLNLFGGVIAAGFRCDGNFSRGATIQSGVRFAESVASVGILLVGASIGQVALTLAATRLCGTVFLAWDLTRQSPWLHFGLRHASAECIRSLFRPALGFLAFPLGNALSLQGMVIVVGHVLGPVAVATFSTMRTLSRFPLMATDVIKNGIWPELSVAFGRSDLRLAQRLYRAACRLTLWSSIAGAIGLWAIGKPVFHLWTHDHIIFEQNVFALLLISVVAASLWSTGSVVVLASNSHTRLALVYVLATSASLAVAFALSTAYRLVGVACAVLVIDIAMCLYTFKASTRALREPAPLFVKQLLGLPSIGQVFQRLSRGRAEEAENVVDISADAR